MGKIAIYRRPEGKIPNKDNPIFFRFIFEVFADFTLAEHIYAETSVDVNRAKNTSNGPVRFFFENISF